MPNSRYANTVIKLAESQDEKDNLDALLWRVLWKPLNLPRDARAKFRIPGEEIELVAVNGRKIVGGLVAYRAGENEVEIRHLAVDSSFQRKSVGTRLLTRLFDLIKEDNPVRIRAYVRNTSYPFFIECGFKLATHDWIEQPDFKVHGITFKLAEKYL